jgi:hypothetical protein
MEILIGAIVSLIVQAVKGKGEYTTLAILVGLSLAASGVYTALVYTGFWDTVYQVLVTAGAFYAFVIQRFESKPTTEPGSIAGVIEG